LQFVIIAQKLLFTVIKVNLAPISAGDRNWETHCAMYMDMGYSIRGVQNLQQK
jgi:hypothetical protein